MHESLLLFRTLFREINNGELIQVSIHDVGISPPPLQQRWFRTPEEASAYAEKFAQGKNVFFGPHPRKNAGATNEDVSRFLVAPVDLDIDPEAGSEKLKKFLLPPCAVVRSGNHSQAYFGIRPTNDEELYRHVVKALSGYFGVMALHGPSQEFRVPGTQHMKDPANPKVCTLTGAFEGVDPSAVFDAKDLIIATSLKGRVYNLIFKDAYPHPGYPSRSERDQAVIRFLWENGMSEDAISYICRHQPFGERYIESRSKFETDLEKVKATAIQNQDPTTFIEARDGQFWIGHTPISTFSMEPTHIVEDPEGDTIVCRVTSSDGRVWSQVQFPRKVFAGLGDFMKFLSSAAWQWTGSRKQFDYLLPYLYKRALHTGVPKVEALRRSGYYDGMFVSGNQIWGAQGQVDPDSTNFILVEPQKHIETFLKEGVPAKGILDAVAGINLPGVIYPIMGWYLAAPFKEWLWHEAEMRFPILMLHGEKGSGKTISVIQIVQRLLGMKRDVFSSSMTDWDLLQVLDSTNTFPTFLDEYRADNKVGPRFFAYLRGSYTRETTRRGTPGLKTVEYKMLSPIVLGGEDAIDDPALLERSIKIKFTVRFSEPAEADRYAYLTEAFEKAERLDLDTFAAGYLRFAAAAIADGTAMRLLMQARKDVRTQYKRNVPSRIVDNMAVVWFGLLMAQEWQMKLPLMETVFYPMLQGMLGSRGMVQVLADEFTQDVINHYATFRGHGWKSTSFPVKETREGYIAFQYSEAIRWWLVERRKAGLPTQTANAVRDQLVGRPYFHGAKAVSMNRGTQHCHLIDLTKAREFGLDVPESLAPELAPEEDPYTI